MYEPPLSREISGTQLYRVRCRRPPSYLAGQRRDGWPPRIDPTTSLCPTLSLTEGISITVETVVGPSSPSRPNLLALNATMTRRLGTDTGGLVTRGTVVSQRQSSGSG